VQEVADVLPAGEVDEAGQFMHVHVVVLERYLPAMQLPHVGGGGGGGGGGVVEANKAQGRAAAPPPGPRRQRARTGVED